MPKFVIERELTGAGKLPRQELQAISQKSCGVLREMGPQIQWQQSFVTDDKIYCIYTAPDEEAVKTHARKGGAVLLIEDAVYAAARGSAAQASKQRPPSGSKRQIARIRPSWPSAMRSEDGLPTGV